MAIQGTFEVATLGTKVQLLNKYMRLSSCTTRNEYRRVSVPQPNGADGNPSSPQEKLERVVEVTGTLDVYDTQADVLSGKAPITSRQYTMIYNNATGAPVPEIQLYAHVMAQPEIVGGVKA